MTWPQLSSPCRVSAAWAKSLSEASRTWLARFPGWVRVVYWVSREVSRWPTFAAAVVEQSDVGALFAVPFQWGAINLGVLDLYRTAPGSLSDVQLRDAISAADMAALMFLGVRTDSGDGEWLDHSVYGRAEIHQATGMVLAQLGFSATDALARMRAYAFVEQRLLSDVAHDVVSRRLRFTQDMK